MQRTPTRGGSLLLGLLWALSLAALCMPLGGLPAAGDAPGWARTLPGTGAWLAAMIAMGIGLRVAGRIPHAFSQVRLWLLAAVLAAVCTLGESFAQTGTVSLITARPWVALLYGAGRVPAFYLGFTLLATALHPSPATRAIGADGAEPAPLFAIPRAELGPDMPLSREAEPGAPAVGVPFAPPTADRHRAQNAVHPAKDRWDRPLPTERGHAASTFGFTLLLLACWAPYLVLLWPGTVSNDSINQLAQALGLMPLSGGNPLFQTGLIWLAVQVGQTLFGSADAAVALYTVTQGVLMAWLLGYALNRIARSRAPGWLGWFAAAFFALNPVFPTFAFCMGKDTNFAMAALWLTLMVWRVLESRWPPLRTLLGLALSAALCVLLRNAGIGLAAVTLGVLLVWALTVRTRQWRAPLAALACSLIAALALTLLGTSVFHAQPMPETENWSVPLQQVARVAASEPLTPEEYAAIDAVLPVDALKTAYQGELSDPVKALWRADATPEQRTAFFGTWLRLCLKHPATCLSATFHNGYGYLLPGYVSTIKPTLLMGMEGRTDALGGAFPFTVNPLAVAAKPVFKSLYALAPYRLLTAPGLYGVLTLFAVAAGLRCRQRRTLIAMLPALFVLAGCLLSAVNGYFRYALPLYFMAPVLLTLVSQAQWGGERVRRNPPARKPAAR